MPNLRDIMTSTTNNVRRDADKPQSSQRCLNHPHPDKHLDVLVNCMRAPHTPLPKSLIISCPFGDHPTPFYPSGQLLHQTIGFWKSYARAILSLLPLSHLPTPFRDPSHEHLLKQEVNHLLQLGAVEPVLAKHRGSRLYLHFLTQKKTGGWSSILDLCKLNNLSEHSASR